MFIKDQLQGTVVVVVHIIILKPTLHSGSSRTGGQTERTVDLPAARPGQARSLLGDTARSVSLRWKNYQSFSRKSRCAATVLSVCAPEKRAPDRDHTGGITSLARNNPKKNEKNPGSSRDDFFFFPFFPPVFSLPLLPTPPLLSRSPYP